MKVLHIRSCSRPGNNKKPCVGPLGAVATALTPNQLHVIWGSAKQSQAINFGAI